MNEEHASRLNEPHANRLYEASSVMNVSTPSRILSAIAGTLLLSRTFSKKSSRLLTLAGGYLVYRALSGNCPVSAMLSTRQEKHVRNTNIRTSIHVNKPREEVYAFWRKLSNLPLFMRHLRSVEETSDTQSHWIASFPAANIRLEWDAAIVEDHPGEMLSWRSLEGSMVENAGKISFEDSPGNSTLLNVVITYRPPAGQIGHRLSALLRPAFRKMVEKDIIAFKEYIEQTAAAPASY